MNIDIINDCEWYLNDDGKVCVDVYDAGDNKIGVLDLTSIPGGDSLMDLIEESGAKIRRCYEGVEPTIEELCEVLNEE